MDMPNITGTTRSLSAVSLEPTHVQFGHGPSEESSLF